MTERFSTSDAKTQLETGYCLEGAPEGRDSLPRGSTPTHGTPAPK